MIERTRYIKDYDGTKLGVITFLYENGKFGAGMSICKIDEDKFDKVAGKTLAMERAVANLNAAPVLLKDLVKVRDLKSLAKITSCSIPKNMNVKITLTDDGEEEVEGVDTVYRMITALEAFRSLFGDMLYTLALTKVREDS